MATTNRSDEVRGTVPIRETGFENAPDGLGWQYTGMSSRGDRVVVTLCWSGGGPPVSTADLRARFRLSPTQARVALLLYSRRTNEEIAALLGIRLSTVRGHVEVTLLKLGIATRVEAQPLLDRVGAEAGLAIAASLPQIRRQVDDRRAS